MSDQVVPHGLTLKLLGDTPGPEHARARQFCLDVIKEFYGFDYKPEWHEDLDSLNLPAQKNHYSPQNRSAFWTVTTPEGELIATAGLRDLSWKPTLLQELSARYPVPDEVASLWRVYIRKDWRSRGLGKWLARLSEDKARELGYKTMYLHASTDATDTMKFWQACGYDDFGTITFSTHFDKKI